jgi:hypothetical protein
MSVVHEVGWTVLLIGGLFLVAGLIQVRSRAGRAQDHRRTARAAGQAHPDLSCGAAAEAADAGAGPIWVAGQTGRGPQGLLRSPHFHMTCVWYYARVSKLIDYHPSAQGTGPNTQHLEMEKEWSSAEPYYIEDGSGRVEVVPGRWIFPDFRDRLAHRILYAHEIPAKLSLPYKMAYWDAPEDPTVVQVNHVGRLRYIYEEWVLPVRSPVHLHGALRREGGAVRMESGYQSPITVSVLDAAGREAAAATREEARAARRELRGSAKMIMLGVVVMFVSLPLVLAHG